MFLRVFNAADVSSNEYFVLHVRKPDKISCAVGMNRLHKASLVEDACRRVMDLVEGRAVSSGGEGLTTAGRQAAQKVTLKVNRGRGACVRVGANGVLLRSLNKPNLSNV